MQLGYSMAKERDPDLAENTDSQDGCYETPWEFFCISSQFRKEKNMEMKAKANCSNISSGSRPEENRVLFNKLSSPACGITARQLLSKKLKGKLPMWSKSKWENQDNGCNFDDEKIWEYRGPEHDIRTSAEYDIPWDLIKKTRERPPAGRLKENVPVSEKLKMVQPQSCSSGVWRKMKTHSASGGDSPVSLGKARWCVKNPSASPATSTSSSAGRTSNRSNNSLESSSNNNYLKSSSSQGSVDAGSDNLKLVEAPLLETAFCGRPLSKFSPQEKMMAEAKDRLIQKVCHETEREFQERTASQEKIGLLDKRAKKPLPAPRKKTETTQNHKTNFSSAKQKIEERVNRSEENRTGCAENGAEEEYDVPWEFCGRRKLNKLLKKSAEVKEASQSASLDRKNLSLDFGCAGLNPVAENVDTSIPLSKQLWYHGSVCRAESELRLAKAKEGSYLIRNCESNRDEYALSVKSAKGFMHMKIQRNNEDKWILGYFSQPFDCIPSMVKYYSVNKLPIKGAEHMCLLHPLHDTLL